MRSKGSWRRVWFRAASGSRGVWWGGSGHVGSGQTRTTLAPAMEGFAEGRVQPRAAALGGSEAEVRGLSRKRKVQEQEKQESLRAALGVGRPLHADDGAGRQEGRG